VRSEIQRPAAETVDEMPERGVDSRPERRDTMTIALLTPTGADAKVATHILAEAALETLVCTTMAALCETLAGGVGAIVIAEEALGATATAALLDALDRQQSWSDVPVIVLTGANELTRAIPRPLEALARRANVTLIERPVRIATLVTVLRSALRARRRQYDVRRLLEERLQLLASERAAREQAEAANRAKTDFLAMMSHELRTPLNAIAGYAELIEMGIRGPITPQQQTDLERIRRSQRHLLSLINDVLNFAKLEAGRVDFDIRTVPMHDVLQDVEALVVPQLRAKRLKYVDAGDCHDIRVCADPEKVRQILVNLLSNAIKFSPSGEEIRVICRSDDAAVRTTIADRGIGIPADKLETVFEPFVQVDRSLTGRQEGTGLGLSISRDLARHMGGDLTVESQPGLGSAFTLILPSAT
jgi:signal transduction histidine kinase